MLTRPLVPRSRVGQTLERWSRVVTAWTGSSWAFAIAVLVIVVWLVTGPIFHFSDTWQLVINTGTTIITFLMVFLIQRAQNKDALAIQLKLNEIVAAISGASNRLIDVENLTEAELQRLHDFYHRLATMAKRDVDLRQSHSIEEAEVRHRRKRSTSGAPASAPTPQTEPDTSG
jgi:low affinity Fe/Cu permease